METGGATHQEAHDSNLMPANMTTLSMAALALMALTSSQLGKSPTSTWCTMLAIHIVWVVEIRSAKEQLLLQNDIQYTSIFHG